MTTAILDQDRGRVNGSTWHKLPQYIQQDYPVTIEEALELVNFPLAKCELYDSDMIQVAGAYCIKRTDTNTVLVPHVGERFTVMDNSYLLNYVNESLLSVFPQLEIESVGTLYNGGTTFINLKTGTMYIKGDESPIDNKLMYDNPLGRGTYNCCAHSTRIVCGNTLAAAQAQGAANETLTKFRHTANAAYKLNARLESLAEYYIGLERYEANLNLLASQDADTAAVTALLEELFPVTGKTKTRALNKRTGVLNIFESDQNMQSGTKYALLNAVTDYYSNEAPTKTRDQGTIIFDNILGRRANVKAQAMASLMATA